MLPLSILYVFSDFAFFVLYRIIGYRRKIVFGNLERSFPEKSPEEIKDIAKKFYSHLCDLIVESIRIFSMPEKEAMARCKANNVDILEKYFQEGRSIILVAGHYNSWELAAITLDPQIPHKAVAIYSPLKNPYFNKMMTQARGKFGLELIPKKEVKSFFINSKNRLTLTIFGGDQSPSNNINVYWTTFLNQETAVMYGTEKYARDYNYPVVFARIRKLKRGYYEMDLEVLEDQPASTPRFEISEKHTRMLEAQIRETPQYWLWTHRRWKRKRPAPVVTPEAG